MAKFNSKSQPVYIVDAFVTKPFTGNPAAVCVLPRPAPAKWMQLVAREMNLSETAFLTGERGVYNLRWFTPTVEMDLCGHATLASAHVLFDTGALPTDRAVSFLTRSGRLIARHRGPQIELLLPATPAKPSKSAPPDLGHSLGAKVVRVSVTKTDYLVELESEQAVRRLKPDIAALKRLGMQGVIVTARADGKPFDFVSRYFAPNVGIDEDPVTGAAHCALGPYWARQLGKKEFEAYQASARGGHVSVRVASKSVYLNGRAVTMMRGELLH